MNDELIAGDTLDFLDDVPDYPPADGWTLKYRLVPSTVGNPVISITATTSGSQYRVQAAAATTAGWAADRYTWTRWVEQGGLRQTVGQGQITVKPDPSAIVAGYDGRTHARKALAAIEAVLEGRASKDQEEYTINNRSLKRTPIADLLVLRSQYRAEVANEDAVAGLSSGLGNPRYIGVRFTRV